LKKKEVKFGLKGGHLNSEKSADELGAGKLTVKEALAE